ncbi:hypothetical protein EXE30_00750 [Acinetobacter halotolerans]|uniref:HEPN AbiJ-N-terminal domain-containing protein n=1 Tax=Acinetobacter halotolerans TaxID=1752076 RepID=A0A4Q6XF02_9GAMM|nr:hypothetical protein [Acinetobacter halotolerans]RZF56823.1 hypothetical protein EXE30_00750 [Acinetobacter halotolerans]
MRFSERYGFKTVRETLLIDRITDDLRNRIWSEIYTQFLKPYEKNTNDKAEIYSYLIEDIWSNFCKLPLDEMNIVQIDIYRRKNINTLKQNIFDSEWFSIYEFLEFILTNSFTNRPYNRHPYNQLVKNISIILEQESSAYRIINSVLVQITSEQEIRSIEDALANTSKFSGIQQHLHQALKLISDRQNPDYRNSIKESISAVESICKIITQDDKATLGKALKIIGEKYSLHAALKSSLSQLYGYTSDGDGIRHAMLEESNLSYIDAKFMLVSCTNFINYLIEKTK